MDPNSLSAYADPAQWMVWLWCRNAWQCGHHLRVDIPAVLAQHGDMTIERFRRRAKCSKCGARMEWRTSACGPANLANSDLSRFK